LADLVVLVGDPERVNLVASFFDSIECDVQNREFHTITGNYRGKRITCLSHGIGTDNIDIVLNELDALANIDFSTRTQQEQLRSLTLVRIGTCGALQADLPVGSYCASSKSIGFDGVLNFYAGRDAVSDLPFEQALKEHLNWNPQWASPYVVDASAELLERIAQQDMEHGVTISANGFYGPQGRELRIPLADPSLNQKISSFVFKGKRITNYEMESSALAGLSLLLGHRALTVCFIIANRLSTQVNSNYKRGMEGLVELVLERI
jgi:uridine phosphorylase